MPMIKGELREYIMYNLIFVFFIYNEPVGYGRLECEVECLGVYALRYTFGWVVFTPFGGNAS
jgi:hypothetical protein